MSKSLSEIAKAVGQTVTACSVVRLHGANVFPPGDVIYQLVAARDDWAGVVDEPPAKQKPGTPTVFIGN